MAPGGVAGDTIGRLLRDWGVAPTTIDNTLYDASRQRQINTMLHAAESVHVILEAEPQFQLDPDKLNHLYIESELFGGVERHAASSSSVRKVRRRRARTRLTGSALFQRRSAKYSVLRRTRLRQALRLLRRARGRTRGRDSSTTSSAVPLSAFSHFETTTEPLSITTRDSFRRSQCLQSSTNAALGGAISEDYEGAGGDATCR